MASQKRNINKQKQAINLFFVMVGAQGFET